MAAIGIPRGLLYYTYYPLWVTFFRELGANVVISGRTTKTLLTKGVKASVDEACLPVKAFHGHVIDLAEKGVDYIFVPRVVSIERKRYICPKFMGLPDMLRSSIPNLPPIIDICINLREDGKSMFSEVLKAGGYFSRNPFKVWSAWQRALKAQRIYEEELRNAPNPLETIERLESFECMDSVLNGRPGRIGGRGFEAREMVGNGGAERKETTRGEMREEERRMRVRIGLLGHPYNLYDEYTSMNIIKRLKDMDVDVITPEMLGDEDIEYGTGWLRKPLYWSLGRKVFGSAGYLIREGLVDGIVHMEAFGCGPDSMVGELMRRMTKRSLEVPCMSLNIDEHTGEAGVITRIEAFVDILKRRMGI